jgi:hypothetical protein
VLEQTARKQRSNEQTADLVPLADVRDQEAKQNDEAQQAYEGCVTSFLFFMEVIMQFVPWKTHFDTVRQQFDTKLDLAAYLKRLSMFSVEDRKKHRSVLGKDWSPKNTDIFLAAELAYIKRGRPYYNFHRSMVEPAARIKLDKIPVSMVDVPRDFQTVNLRFPDDMDYVSLLATKSVDDDNIIIFFVRSRTDAADTVILFSMDCSTTESVEEALVAVVRDGYTDRPLDVPLRELLRCYVVTQFLADCPDENLIEYDILSKHRSEWVHATPERKLEIIELARQKGKKGWNIGVSSVLLADAPRLSAPKGEVQDPSGELRHSHIRTGHLHCVRCGKNKGDVKIMWYRPTVVRPDLPFKP